ncbi:MAG: hypothetical protein ACOYN2_03490 [Patescibacteria group bacterium]
MLIKTEIKDFVRKVLLLGILLSFVINFAFTYFASFASNNDAHASKNELSFKRQDTTYLGDTGVALSLNIGLSDKAKKETPIRLYEEVMPISSVLADKTTGTKKIIASHMIAAQEYMNILRTDVNKLLDGTSDRQAMLESFIDQLKFRGKATNAYLASLTSQRAQLAAAITTSTTKIEGYKTTLSTAYKNMDYDLTQDTLDKYLEEKQTQTYAQSYLVFLDKFVATYQALNAYNAKLLDTITNNKEALIKNVTVVLPDSGNDFMKKLELLRSQSDTPQGQ